MRPLITICTPIYNAAPYIERCVHSLMQQSYENIEYIFVNDCSTDNSNELLNTVIACYPNRQTQVTILHNKQNLGAAYSRHIGVDSAHGDFVIFIDADDYIETNMVERLYQGCDGDDCDIVLCGFSFERGPQKEYCYFSKVAQHNDLLYAALVDDITYLCGKLFRRSLLVNPSIPPISKRMDYMEDRLLIFYMSKFVHRVNVINEPLYHYVLHEDSASYIKTEKHILCLIQYWQLVDKFLKETQLTDYYQKIIIRKKIEDKIHLLHFCKDISVCRKYADLFPEEEAQHPKLQLSRGLKITRFLTKHHLWGLLFVYKTYFMKSSLPA